MIQAKFSVFIPLLVLLVLMGCGEENNPAGAGSTTELEGTWVGTTSPTPGSDWKFVFSGNTIEAFTNGMEAYKGTFTLNTATDPKQFTCKIVASPSTEYVGKESLAIYRISGTSLAFAGNEPGNPNRPASFTASGQTMSFQLNKW
jgi:uncharacterized protein (TIGR03067 family)